MKAALQSSTDAQIERLAEQQRDREHNVEFDEIELGSAVAYELYAENQPDGRPER